MPTTWVRTGLVLVALSGVAAEAAAQVTDAPVPTTRPLGAVTVFRSGAFAVAPTLRVANVGMDANVFDEAGHRDTDFTATLSPGVDIGVRAPRITFVTRAQLEYAYYRKHTGERSLNPTLEISAERRFSSLFAIFALGNAGWSKSRTGLEIDARVRTQARSVTLGTRIGGRRLRIELAGSGARRTKDNNPNYLGVALGPELDRNTVGGIVRTSYRLTPLTTVGIDTSASADRFVTASWRDTNTYRVDGTAAFSPRAILQGGGRIGFRSTQQLRGNQAAFRGLVAQGGLTWIWRDRLSVSGGAERDVDYSYQEERLLFVYALGEAAVRQRLWGGFDVGVRSSRTRMTYLPAFAALPPSAVLDREYLREVTLTVGKQMRNGMRVGLYASEWERGSKVNPYKAPRYGVEFTYGRARVNERGVAVYGPGR